MHCARIWYNAHRPCGQHLIRSVPRLDAAADGAGSAGGPGRVSGQAADPFTDGRPYEEAISDRVAANYPAFVQAAWEFR